MTVKNKKCVKTYRKRNPTHQFFGGKKDNLQLEEMVTTVKTHVHEHLGKYQ